MGDATRGIDWRLWFFELEQKRTKGTKLRVGCRAKASAGYELKYLSYLRCLLFALGPFQSIQMSFSLRLLVAVFFGLVVACPAFAQLRKEGKRAGTGNEIEGAAWEYIATKTGKEEAKRGKIRIADGAIFELGKGPRLAEREKRVGNIVVSKDKDEAHQLIFTDLPDLPGRAFVRQDQKTRNFTGHFDEKGGARWKFELRRLDD